MNVKNAINDFAIENGECKILCGLSGGADSVAMTYALKKNYQENIFAVHINHNLRGEDSNNDQYFVKKFCDLHKIPLFIKSVNIVCGKHESTEEVARLERYAAFDSINNEEFDGKSLIAIAHNADDNAETMIFNLIRGTGLKGLCGIPTTRGNIVRPLLKCPRSEIESYISENNLDFVTDKTNLSDEYARNKIRHHIIPEIAKINPSFVETFSRAAEILKKDEEYIDKKCQILYNKIYIPHNLFDLNLLQNTESPILERIISRILGENNVEPSYLRINGAVKIIKLGKGKVNIAKNTFMVAESKTKTFFITKITQNYRR